MSHRRRTQPSAPPPPPPPPPTNTTSGQWKFDEEAQSAHLITAGF